MDGRHTLQPNRQSIQLGPSHISCVRRRMLTSRLSLRYLFSLSLVRAFRVLPCQADHYLQEAFRRAWFGRSGDAGFSPQSALNSGLHKASEQGMRLRGLALEFWMELHGYKPGMVR